MKNRLKQAVASREVPVNLERRIRDAIRDEEGQAAAKPVHFWTWALPGAAVAAMAAIALVFVFSRSGGVNPAGSPDAYIAAVTSRVSALMRVGLGDHIHCAVFRKYPKTPAPLETMKKDLGPEYEAVLTAVQANSPSEYHVRLAHKCRFQGRQFVHLVLKDEAKLVSVVVTAKRDGEALPVDRLVPALATAGIPFYQQGVEQFQIAAFENPGHFIYLISDLPEAKNLQMLRAMASDLAQALPKS